MDFEYTDYEDFELIREAEIALLDQLQLKYTYKVDEYGDLLLDNNDHFVIDYENPIGRISNPLYPELEGLDNRVDFDIINGYKDVLGIDELKKNDPRFKLLVALRPGNRIFEGVVWTWEDENYIGIYGIRSSISNYLLGVKGTASAIINKVKEIAGERRVIVSNPLLTMISLLERKGFTESNDPNTPEYEFSKIADEAYGFWYL